MPLRFFAQPAIVRQFRVVRVQKSPGRGVLKHTCSARKSPSSQKITWIRETRREREKEKDRGAGTGKYWERSTGSCALPEQDNFSRQTSFEEARSALFSAPVFRLFLYPFMRRSARNSAGKNVGLWRYDYFLDQANIFFILSTLNTISAQFRMKTNFCLIICW